MPPWPGSPPAPASHYEIAGVPCLTLAGSCHAHNVGVSLLTAVGLQDDWVAHSGGPPAGLLPGRACLPRLVTCACTCACACPGASVPCAAAGWAR